MIRMGFVILFVLLLNACSGYFTSDDQKSGDTLEPLAISGGGYLSSDTANDITPFVYRDNGRAWLFFASDRSGKYEIYYAEMFSNGKFSSPVRMDVNINNGGIQTYPVVVKYSGSPCIGFARYSAGYHWVYFYQLNNNFSFNQQLGSVSMVSFSNLGLMNGSTPYLVAADTVGLRLYDMPNLTPELYYPTISPTPASANGFLSTPLDFIVFENNGRLFFGSILDSVVNGGFPMTNVPIPDYDPGNASIHDMSPFVDTADGYKLYFASDRYGKGNFDLYRYNTKTFNTILVPPQNLNVGYQSSTTATVTWDAVPGADNYLIYKSSDGGATYNQFAQSSATSCVVTLSGGNWVKVKSVRNGKQSDFSLPYYYAGG